MHNILHVEENGPDNKAHWRKTDEWALIKATQSCVVAASCLATILSWPSPHNKMD